MTRDKWLKLLFFKDTFLLIASLVFIWMTVSLLADQNYALPDLKPYKGTLINMDSVITQVKNKPLFKEVTKQLRLKINTEKQIFTLSSSTGFGDVVSKLTVGDTITIYTKPKFGGIFGMRRASDINHLTNNNLVVVDYSEYKNSIKGLFLLTLSFGVGFLIWYIVKVRHRIYWEFGGYKKYMEQRIK